METSENVSVLFSILQLAIHFSVVLWLSKKIALAYYVLKNEKILIWPETIHHGILQHNLKLGQGQLIHNFLNTKSVLQTYISIGENSRGVRTLNPFQYHFWFL